MEFLNLRKEGGWRNVADEAKPTKRSQRNEANETKPPKRSRSSEVTKRRAAPSAHLSECG
jgi:hypothetical protein